MAAENNKTMHPASLEDFKEMLSSGCIFAVEGRDGLFSVDREGNAFVVSDIASAPVYYCESFDSVDDMMERMLVGKLRSDKESGRVKVIDGTPLRECWQSATVSR